MQDLKLQLSMNEEILPTQELGGLLKQNNGGIEAPCRVDLREGAGRMVLEFQV